jgi:hypothetical protein
MSEEVHEDRHEGENSKDDRESSFFVSGSSTDFTPAFISAHISRERTLNRTIWKYVATFKVYFRNSISEKSNPGE